MEVKTSGLTMNLLNQVTTIPMNFHGRIAASAAGRGGTCQELQENLCPTLRVLSRRDMRVK